MAWIYEVTDTVPWANYASTSQIQNNSREIYNWFNARGVTLEAICGMIGNMRHESYLNPGQYQLGSASDPSQGAGLIQWTPRANLFNYVTGNWYNGSSQCDLIWREGTGEAGGRWIPTDAYPYSWDEYCSLKDVNRATRAYLAERERAGVEALDLRLQYAAEAYSYLSGVNPPGPDPPGPTPAGSRRKLKPYMYLRRHNATIRR